MAKRRQSGLVVPMTVPDEPQKSPPLAQAESEGFQFLIAAAQMQGTVQEGHVLQIGLVRMLLDDYPVAVIVAEEVNMLTQERTFSPLGLFAPITESVIERLKDADGTPLAQHAVQDED